MLTRPLTPLEKALFAYVIALTLLLALAWGVNALVDRLNAHPPPAHSPISLLPSPPYSSAPPGIPGYRAVFFSSQAADG